MNWYAYVGNNPISRIDPEGRSAQDIWETIKALGSYEGSWRAAFSPKCTGSITYYNAYIKGMTGWDSLVTTAPTAYSHRGLGPLWTARSYYVATDARFTNWGRSSKVLVPNAVARIAPWAERANAVGTLVTIGQSAY